MSRVHAAPSAKLASAFSLAPGFGRPLCAHDTTIVPAAVSASFPRGEQPIRRNARRDLFVRGVHTLNALDFVWSDTCRGRLVAVAAAIRTLFRNSERRNVQIIHSVNRQCKGHCTNGFVFGNHGHRSNYGNSEQPQSQPHTIITKLEYRAVDIECYHFAFIIDNVGPLQIRTHRARNDKAAAHIARWLQSVVRNFRFTFLRAGTNICSRCRGTTLWLGPVESKSTQARKHILAGAQAHENILSPR